MSIAVFLESYNGKIVKAAAEAVTAAKQIAGELGTSLFGVVIDDDIDPIIAQAGQLGITSVKTTAKISLYHPNMYTRLIANAVGDASAVVFPATVWGRELAPMVAVKIDATPVVDIIGIEDATTYKRSVHGNKIHTTVKSQGKVVLTIRPGIFDVPASMEGSATAESITAEAVDGDGLLKLAEVLAASTDKIELTEADIIVSGGRGVGGPENFNLIEGLADSMGAAVGASRAVVDAGWRPHEEQVGQTGKFVSPKVYVAVGISGAIQHLAGMSTSDIIVAVNKDPDAPIFKIADYGLVGDLFDVVPKLTEAVKKVKAEV